MVVVEAHFAASIPLCPAHNHRREQLRQRLLPIVPEFNYVSCIKAPDSTSLTQVTRKTCECFDLHKEIIPYSDAWSWQKCIVKEKKALIAKNEEFPDTLIVLQHRPVYTMGAASSEEYLNFDMKDSPYDIYRTERGGEVTYHGPGQLVVYPIMNLRNHKMDLHWYLRSLEEVVIRVLSSTFSIKASRVDGLTGVWGIRN